MGNTLKYFIGRSEGIEFFANPGVHLAIISCCVLLEFFSPIICSGGGLLGKSNLFPQMAGISLSI